MFGSNRNGAATNSSISVANINLGRISLGFATAVTYWSKSRLRNLPLSHYLTPSLGVIPYEYLDGPSSSSSTSLRTYKAPLTWDSAAPYNTV